ncbi:uncharacterized protein LOC129959288 [Argiope bruennichi]|uniref:uncharacterized protein LOC129959288 n=1 Tax=Argiope bruennichi TaxID=94029 RepID=UPI002493F03C|nr:uncharacterized protein LOC129959288 [Argiope bruennichi]
MLESDSDQEKACAAAAYVLLSGDYLRKKMEKRNRRWWMTSLNESRKRYSATDMLSDLKQEPSGKFQNFFRMSATDFESLLGKIGKFIAKKSTNMREPIPIQERLAVTLIFFATGDSQSSLSYLFKFSKQTISRCIDDVCKAIIQELKEEIKLPKNEDEWLCIAQQYENQWNFPSCLRAIDGKHVVIQCQIIHLQSTFDTEADGEVVPGSWRNDQSGMTSFMPLKKAPRKSGEVAISTLNCFAEYFSRSGKLSWQDKYC